MLYYAQPAKIASTLLERCRTHRSPCVPLPMRITRASNSPSQALLQLVPRAGTRHSHCQTRGQRAASELHRDTTEPPRQLGTGIARSLRRSNRWPCLASAVVFRRSVACMSPAGTVQFVPVDLAQPPTSPAKSVAKGARHHLHRPGPASKSKAS
jgi:hypothetical protein